MMTATQQTFNPVDFGFEFTADGWYKWDRKAGHKAAMTARNEAAKEAQQRGRQVRKFSLASQLVSRGGIGSGHPHIEQVVTVYGFNAN